jgi:hypothetical protein
MNDLEQRERGEALIRAIEHSCVPVRGNGDVNVVGCGGDQTRSASAGPHVIVCRAHPEFTRFDDALHVVSCVVQFAGRIPFRTLFEKERELQLSPSAST